MLAGGFLLMTGGCDDKDKIEEEIPEVSPESPDKFVYVIFPVNALGDHAYNDLVLAGILEAQKKAGFYTMLYAPIDMEEGILMLNLALDGIGCKARNCVMDLETTCSCSKQMAPICPYIPFSSTCMVHLI